MNKRFEQILQQKEKQMASKHMRKMFNISWHGFSANQDHPEILLYTPLEQLEFERLTTLCVGKVVEQMERSNTAGGSVKWYNPFGKLFVNFSKNKIRTYLMSPATAR